MSEGVVGLGGLFGDPPREFGLCPNWWWEGGVVSEEKLSWMLSEMARVGVGATFFYMRYSGDEPFAVVPAYGSDEFYELFEFSLGEHRRLGLGAYFSEWTGAHPVAERVGGAEAGLGGWRLVVGGGLSVGVGDRVVVVVPGGVEVLCAAAFRVGRLGVLDVGSRVELLGGVVGGSVVWVAPEAGWRVVVVWAEAHGVDWLNPVVAERWAESLWGPFWSGWVGLFLTRFGGMCRTSWMCCRVMWCGRRRCWSGLSPIVGMTLGRGWWGCFLMWVGTRSGSGAIFMG